MESLSEEHPILMALPESLKFVLFFVTIAPVSPFLCFCSSRCFLFFRFNLSFAVRDSCGFQFPIQVCCTRSRHILVIHSVILPSCDKDPMHLITICRYHSHVAGQYPDGLLGPLIVEDPSDPHADLYDEELVAVLQDWFHARGMKYR